MPPRDLVANGSLDDMFTRLSAGPIAGPSRPAEEISFAGPDKSMFSFEDSLNIGTAARGASTPSKDQAQPRSATSLPSSMGLQSRLSHPEVTAKTQQASDRSLDQVEQDYLRKAAVYLRELPSEVHTSAYTIQAAAAKLQMTYTLNPTNLQPEEVEKLQARFVFAVLKYINKKVKLNPEPLTADLVKKMLRNSDGSILQLYASLVDAKHIALDNLEHITGLCQKILDVLPEAESISAIGGSETSNVHASNTKAAIPSSSAIDRLTMATDDPLEGARIWPSQEKREHGE